MRPFLTLAIAGLLLGGVFAYTRFAASIQPVATTYQTELATEPYSVEIRRTFIAAPLQDPVGSIDVRPETESLSQTSVAALQVHFKGVPILHRSDEIQQEEPIVIPLLEGVEIGDNELFISANQKLPNDVTFAALQVRVLQGAVTIAESTFTSVRGSPLIYGVLVFSATPPPEHDVHTH